MPAQTGARGEEPPMFLQRPSTGKSQDVRHILAKTFREIFTRDPVGTDTMKNLAVSKGGDDPYHERYVESLQKVFDERQRRMEEAAMLERHIMQAQARAMSADERELNRANLSCDNYGDLGLPPGRSNFRSCIDTELLKKHRLLTPSDYSTEEPAPIPPPLGPKVPSYARETMTSRQHTREDLFSSREIPKPDALELKRSRSDLGGSMISEEPLIDQERRKDEEFLAKFPRSDAWKQQMREDQREQERTSLNNLQAMTNYSRNPRFIPPSAPGAGSRSLIKAEKSKPKQIGIQEKQVEVKKSEEHSQVFLVSPPEVVFSEYKVGQVYELTLTLKNVSSCIRQCRALPVSTPYFSLGLGQFPGEHGLVAPGMSCHYAVRFAPDSLRDFHDEIKIQTQSTVPITVPLLGRRPPPKLTLPSVVDVGYCLVGGCHVTQLVVKNEGGPGRFCIMPSSAWPTTNFKSVVHNGNVPIPPFDIRPAVLEIAKDDTVVMDIVFQPPQVKSYSVDMCMVCDNCNVKHFSIKEMSAFHSNG